MRILVNVLSSSCQGRTCDMPVTSTRSISLLKQSNSRLALLRYFLYLLKLFEYGVAQDQVYLAMELIGYDLEEIMTRMKTKKFSLKTVLMIGLQVIDRI